jgi:hypothetical protein
MKAEKKPGNGKNPPTPVQPVDIFHTLRDQILNLDPAEVGMAPSADLPNVWGILMETAYPEAFATLVSLADGTTSLYFSNGGGIIGGGQHPAVAKATRSFVAAAENYFHEMTLSNDHPLPAPGGVRFHVLTYQGSYTTEADENDLGNHRHALSPLFYAGQDVLTQLRIMRDSKK